MEQPEVAVDGLVHGKLQIGAGGLWLPRKVKAMQLIPTDFGWLLRMDEGRIKHIGVDFRLVLLFGDKTETASLCIETPCYIRSEGKNTRLVPDAPSTLAPALTLFNAEITDISILKTGYLTAKFKDGRSLEIEPNEQYEAWQVSSTNGFLLVCSPGGEIAMFHQPSSKVSSNVQGSR